MKLLVFDGNSIINRAFYAIKKSDYKGRGADKRGVWVFEAVFQVFLR